MIAKRLPALAAAAVTSATLVAAGTAVAAPARHPYEPAQQRHGVTQTNLVSDVPGMAQITDPNLANAWGMSHGPDTPVWVSDTDTGVSTLYTGAVNGSPVATAPAGKQLVVKIPGGLVTGQTFNSASSGFVVPGTNAPANFVFATIGGTIAAWNGAAGTQAVTVATTPGAIYTGLTEVQSKFGPLLLAANFHNNSIDVFDSSFHKINARGMFRDRSLPRGFAPFNVQVLGNSVYVAYAKQDADKGDTADGAGRGFVDRFTTIGTHPQRVVSRGALNSPWGLDIAPAKFGRFSNDLLVGNFGDGTIHAYNPHTGRFLGTLTDTKGHVIKIERLWSLLNGDAVAGGPNAVWFSAGPDAEMHGLLGTLTAR
ncbi:TIGR03118 family protein [Kribbella pittospori]|uniref:TIGR03118 family protein n=1 Tax=Kribbella pittospori TaxID=722689 RepID=A0A4R0JUZ6_9ACTN|nr:TIGR03118 family protein [Kribbella pittospori]TCC50397.1 TIGR03118 family protein [Kribbella pittospori]